MHLSNDKSGKRTGWRAPETGSAVVEFVMLGAVLLVPILYFVMTMGTLQGASFAAAGAADHAAKVFVRSDNLPAARAAAEAVGKVAVADFGMEPGAAAVKVVCDRPNCLEAGTAVTVTVEVDVPLPMAPSFGMGQISAGRAVASATQIAGRFR